MLMLSFYIANDKPCSMLILLLFVLGPHPLAVTNLCCHLCYHWIRYNFGQQSSKQQRSFYILAWNIWLNNCDIRHYSSIMRNIFVVSTNSEEVELEAVAVESLSRDIWFTRLHSGMHYRCTIALFQFCEQFCRWLCLDSLFVWTRRKCSCYNEPSYKHLLTSH